MVDVTEVKIWTLGRGLDFFEKNSTPIDISASRLCEYLNHKSEPP